MQKMNSLTKACEVSLEDLRNWCRFCGIHKNNLCNLLDAIFLEVISKLFSFSIVNLKVCYECQTHLESICKFYIQVKSVSQKFFEIKQSAKDDIPADYMEISSNCSFGYEHIKYDLEDSNDDVNVITMDLLHDSLQETNAEFNDSQEEVNQVTDTDYGNSEKNAKIVPEKIQEMIEVVKEEVIEIENNPLPDVLEESNAEFHKSCDDMIQENPVFNYDHPEKCEEMIEIVKQEIEEVESELYNSTINLIYKVESNKASIVACKESAIPLKRFACAICGKQYSKNWGLKKHELNRSCLKEKRKSKIKGKNNTSTCLDEKSITKLKLKWKYLGEPNDIFQLPQKEFLKNFRINKEQFVMILENVYSKESPGITSPIVKLAVTLYFLASGGLQGYIANNGLFSMTQPTVSNIVENSLELLENILCPQWVQIKEENFDATKEYFFKNYNFPEIIGVMDNTHLPIFRPNKRENIYCNPMGFNSLNCMIVCNHKNEIISLDASNAGSVLDSAVWNKSVVFEYLQKKYEEGEFFGKIISDIDYPVQPWLLTPYKSAAEGTGEMAFNYAHEKARNVIERTIGILKARWKCLSYERQKFRFKPYKVARIVNVCAALHNICIHFNNELNEEDEVEKIINQERNAQEILFHTGHLQLKKT